MVCTCLWIACEDTPPTLCTAWGGLCEKGRFSPRVHRCELGRWSPRPVRKKKIQRSLVSTAGSKLSTGGPVPRRPAAAGSRHPGAVTERTATGPPHDAGRAPAGVHRTLAGLSAGPASIRWCVRSRTGRSPRSSAQSTSWQPIQERGSRERICVPASPESGPCWRRSTLSWPGSALPTSRPGRPGRPGRPDRHGRDDAAGPHAARAARTKAGRVPGARSRARGRLQVPQAATTSMPMVAVTSGCSRTFTW